MNGLLDAAWEAEQFMRRQNWRLCIGDAADRQQTVISALFGAW
jgi:hypothetical protein